MVVKREGSVIVGSNPIFSSNCFSLSIPDPVRFFSMAFTSFTLVVNLALLLLPSFSLLQLSRLCFCCFKFYSHFRNFAFRTGSGSHFCFHFHFLSLVSCGGCSSRFHSLFLKKGSPQEKSSD